MRGRPSRAAAARSAGAALVASGAVALAVGVILAASGGLADRVTSAPFPAAGPPSPPVSARSVARPAHRAPRPVRVEIPAIGVRATLVALGLDAAGALEAPKGFSEAGWWTGGARPGEPGPAIIAGHVDGTRGPAVFFRIGALRRGDRVDVVRRDGSRVRFSVQASARYRKDRFPSRSVYGPTAGPELRLITCSGAFDRTTGHYVDNTVVYAVEPGS
jgi:hypothetical protein